MKVQSQLPPWFRDQEYQQICLVACGPYGATEKQIQAFIEGCERIKSESLLLELILNDLIEVVKYEGNEPCFSRKVAKE